MVVLREDFDKDNRSNWLKIIFPNGNMRSKKNI